MKTITSARRPARMNAAIFAILQRNRLAAMLLACALVADLGMACILVFKLGPAKAAPRRPAMSDFSNLDAVASANPCENPMNETPRCDLRKPFQPDGPSRCGNLDGVT